MASQLAYPVKVHARPDEHLSRWLWLVKWLLAIPHYVVLAFLWAAFAVLSVVAFFAILLTGRYPRPIFEFNVGVLRWSWRVAYYSYGALATDRYPPFTIREVPDYPVHLDIDYPAHLSRGLVLVKWWLLAIPHYIVVGLFMGGAWVAFRGDNWQLTGPGLIGFLALVAAVTLAFTGRYPNGLFDLLLGLNRWVIRVAAYAGLMTDTYPPFRLDLGGDEPGETAVDRTQPPPSGSSSAPTAAARGWTAGPIIAVIAGALIALMSLGMLVGGGVTLWADRTQREAGFVTSPTVALSSASYAIVSDSMEIHAEGPDWILPQALVGDARLRVTSTQDIFVGVGPTSDVSRYLAGVSHAMVSDLVRFDGVDLPATAGGAPTTAPGDESFWVAASEGRGTRSITWPVDNGSWSVVVMNADGRAGVDVRGDAGAEAPVLGAIAIGLLVLGAAFLVIGTALIYGGVARAGSPADQGIIR